jgi:hypothetical protein
MAPLEIDFETKIKYKKPMKKKHFFKNFRTTIAGIVVIVATILNLKGKGWVVTPEDIATLGAGAAALAAKDAPVTGGEERQD